MMARSTNNRSKSNQQTLNENRKKEQPAEITMEKLLGSEILEMELGAELIPLADPQSGGILLPAVTKIRKDLASELGVILPKIRIRDNLQLPTNEYRILVHGNPVDLGTILVKHELAIDRGHASGPISGAVATETTEDGQAFWILPEHRPAAIQLGYHVFSPTSVLTRRMSRIANAYAPEFLTRDATMQLIEETRKSSPAIVGELLPDVISLKQLQQVLKQLVAEQVSIRPLGLILETIGDAFSGGRPLTWQLAEIVRQRLAPQITARFLRGRHSIKAVTINDPLQDRVEAEFSLIDGDKLSGPAQLAEALACALKNGIENMKENQLEPIVCVHQPIRPIISRLLKNRLIEGVVLGSKEIAGTFIESVGEIAVDQSVTESVAA
jgi:flagellar biosynthesis protein FlhA